MKSKPRVFVKMLVVLSLGKKNIKLIKRLSIGVIAVSFVFLFTGSVFATPIVFDDFSSIAGLSLNEDAAQVSTSDGTVLRLTSATADQKGSAFSTTALNASEFSTSFKFRITDPGGISDGTEVGGDGLVFVIQSLSTDAVGGGGGIGYGGMLQSVGIEFDTWQYSAWDPSSNHVGINMFGAMDSIQAIPVVPNFDDGSIWYSWIDYDGSKLEVRANQTGVRPTNVLLSLEIDIPSILGQSDAFVGFTSGTAAAYANHDILSWEYRPIPEPSTVIFLSAGLLGIFVLVWRKRHPRI